MSGANVNNQRPAAIPRSEVERGNYRQSFRGRLHESGRVTHDDGDDARVNERCAHGCVCLGIALVPGENGNHAGLHEYGEFQIAARPTRSRLPEAVVSMPAES